MMYVAFSFKRRLPSLKRQFPHGKVGLKLLVTVDSLWIAGQAAIVLEGGKPNK
jgi:hypothetical protein